MNKIIGVTLIAPLLLGNMQAGTTTAPKAAPKPTTVTPAKPTPPTPTPAKPVATTPTVTKPVATTTAPKPAAKPEAAGADAAKSDIPIVKLTKPTAPVKPAFAVKPGETAKQIATRTGTDVDVLCFMTLGTFSAVAMRNTKERTTEEKMFLSKVDAGTDFFMGRASTRFVASGIEAAMRKAGALITSDTLGPMSEPCMAYYDETFAPIAAQIKSAPTEK